MPHNELPSPPPNRGGAAIFSTQKTLASAANLSNLLPTSTVLIFQTLKPSLSNKGICQLPNKYLTIILISFCAIICFLSSFTDSFVNSNRKLYHGIATFNGLYIFNSDDEIRSQNRRKGSLETTMDNEDNNTVDLSKFKIGMIDFIHAIVSMFVFLAFGFSDGDVQKCLLGRGGGGKMDLVVMNLRLVFGAMASLFFVIFPTMRRGIGYGEMANRLR
ncbi:hypothetical protein CDL12_14715 [Handroanthus impetiginosus]|uniref:Uncharacterized protein n=1 Tax=Handroanthus impetiginosus TaxID=429701 RepID=A0A2G9H583_9LAMI|nr:hypothetical protein CDL12_14715 [Handroanthus impetiginosus]